MADLPTGADVLGFLGWASDAEISAQADRHVYFAMQAVAAYVRGRGFYAQGTDGPTKAEDPICAVIISAAARSVNNPTLDTRVEVGTYNAVSGSFAGWSLAELAILHQYRRTAG
ncbi:MAG: hypothetical protein JWR35_3927 [Marmoricola sp.]|nr:hypothetical protein [Marmoricola sp.]